MTWYQTWCHLLTLVLSVVQVHSDAMLSNLNLAALVDTVNDVPLPGLHGTVPNMQETQMPTFFKQKMTKIQGNIPKLNGPNGPLDIMISSERTNMSPPVAPSKFLTLPQFPVGFVDFQVNQSKHRFVSSKQQTNYISVPPGAPVDFLKVPSWKTYVQAHAGSQSGGKNTASPHQHALGLVVQGPVIEGKPPAVQVDPVHHLPMNHLFVPVPVTHLSSEFAQTGKIQPAPPPPTVADILIVIDASDRMGHIDANGGVVWNPNIVDFLNKFTNFTPIGPDANRIGVVVVSVGIDDMIPLTDDRQFLIDSLNLLRPSFRGGCTEKGINTASSLFYQYGRQTAVKRIVLLTEGSGKCSYRNMAEIIYARKCGIDIIHVGFGSMTNPATEQGLQSSWIVPGPDMLISVAEPVAKRAYINPIHGGWSQWSDWNLCSASGTCSLGYQMRFRLCDNPKPAYGGQNCRGFPAVTRMCHMRPCIDNTMGHWTRWTEFTPCSSPCGIGSRTRSRTCLTLSGEPSAACRGKYVEVVECIVKACPVDGGWSFWSEWGLCSKTCGMGIKMRARQCDNPLPKHGGKTCPGSALEETVCDMGKHCPIHGGFGPWTQSGKCDAVCGFGMQKRTRECDSPFPQYGGNPCVGESVIFEPCDSGIPCSINGEWGQWTKFTECSAKCGTGVRKRKRFCDSPPPKYGGAMCEGPKAEKQNCDTGIACPIDGQWSAWTDFAPCSAKCGTGKTRRFRLCNNPVPMHGGKDCIGSPVDEQHCDTYKICPIDGGWSKWTKYSTCNADCGRGLQGRTRACIDPAPQYGGAYCVGLDREERECDTGISCPVHGFWSHWLPWGHCSASCGIGFRQRHRLCNNPSPKFGGLECEGSLIEEDVCDTKTMCPIHGGWSKWSKPLPCPVDCGVGTTKRVRECNSPVPMYGGNDCSGPNTEFIKCDSGLKCPIHGKWSLWSKWSICEAECGTAMQSRIRTCDNPAPKFGGLACKGPGMEKRPCDTGKQCPVHGGWGLWTMWTKCSVYCGTGMISRKRVCDSPMPQYGGKNCLGLEYEEMPCETGVMCPIDGGWSAWSDLSSCSETCGVGFMQRSRICNSPLPQYNGAPCPGPDFEKLPCDTGTKCPVHGNWGPWTDYAICEAKCGKGVQTRTRICNSPAPMFGGDSCVGADFEKIPCDSGVFCPVNGEWGPWTEFTHCNKKCGVGIIRRFRQCNNPAPSYGGHLCVGLEKEEQMCDTGIYCPIDGNWGLWSAFTKCSVTCGFGTQQRNRECNNPHPSYGGGDCAGHPLETRNCDTGTSCAVNGGWSAWTGFGPCDVKCGAGMQKRKRYCSNPVPMYGGDDCHGKGYDERPCETGIKCPVHGSWTLWSGWTACSKDCGSGSSVRTRQCSNPPPMYGGNPCKGHDTEETICDTGIKCPIHGGWSMWSDYSPCSVSCGTGMMQRIRVCDSPMPQYGGKVCIGDSTEGAVCDTKIKCPIHGGFSLWSKWSRCSVDCGEGLQYRTRLCNSPVPEYGGVPCKGIFKEERICDTGIFCPINGNWGAWSPFTQCSVDCGSGIKERTRFCDNPIPMYGGKPCPGSDSDQAVCDTGIHCPVHGDWEIWTAWTSCSVTCDVGVVTRKRSCTNPKPMYGGRLCKGDSLQEKVCNTGVSCPINGMWSFWSDWLPCDVTCEAGTQSRLRICNNPPAQYGGDPCFGSAIDSTVCDTGVPCPVIGNWSPWSVWSDCTATCADGLQQRIRTCTDPPPKYGGDICPGNAEEVRKCNTDIFCPVDGHWAPWTKWTHCSRSCGIGVHARTRTCTNPPPEYGGKFCVGPQDDTGDCVTGVHCPIDGDWGPWTSYGKCSVNCGIGTKTRTRLCDNPRPQYGGSICYGGNTEDITCNTGKLCPINGAWTQWSQFRPCNVDCGIGVQNRTRSCTNPAPKFGGLDCEGPALDVLHCDTGKYCPIDGRWSLWYEWAPCFGNCGIGKRERKRECNNPKPNFGGQICKGPNVMSEDCDTGIHCPVPGGWSNWSPPGPCSVSCGVGTQTRVRNCNNPMPQYGGPDCVGLQEEILKCDTLIACPIDGLWGSWSEYGPCNVKCGIGLHARTRECNSPPPQYGGNKCVGSNMEETKCDTNKKCVIHGGWSFWSPWSTCQSTCGAGEKIRVRVCNNPSPLYGGLMCKGPDTDVMPCKTDVSCPIDGGWTLWTDWDMCSVTCGTGKHSRYRKCTAPIPQYGGLQCKGPARETQDCVTGIPCAIDGHWTLWTLWSGCSETCGVGVRKRERFCDNPPAQFGGAPCMGIHEETEKCVTGVSCPVHGSWSFWSPWSVCMADCGIGKKIRNRICNNPAPLYGGLDCIGLSEEMRDCDTKKHCPINGNWGLWMAWSSCSAYCGSGERRRIRKCDNPPAQYGGTPCKGFAEEIEICNAPKPCAIDGQWSLWGTFSACSATCNMGTQIRSRVCNDPPPQYGGVDCKGPAEETISCKTGVPCAVNGNWGGWYPWSKCSVTCGSGEVERHRDCNNPIPQYGGLPCVGPAYEIGTCDTKISCPIHGGWSSWSHYTPCTGKCGIGFQERYRECNNPPPKFGGDLCYGLESELIDCDTHKPCAIDGQWGMWMKWTACNVKCGVGVHSRKRECNSPPPQYGGRDCSGINIEEKKCDTLRNCAVHGGWSFWSKWTACSASCAMGTKTRYRECTNPAPLYGGLVCKGPDQEMVKCDSGVPCPVDGQWSAWYKWSVCSVQCGIGVKERIRECNAPPPQYGGMPCKGPKTEIADCNSGIHCPVDGQWTLWSPWGGCSRTCGTGMQRRTRQCANPVPAYGGAKCKGFAEELRQCDTGYACAVNGNWGMWSEFSMCSASCGVGVQERVRLCDNPPPMFGGMECPGSSVEMLKCKAEVPCAVDGSWTSWSMWTNCDATCGVGIRERWRQCTNPRPSSGGKPCSGPQLEIVDCENKVPCAVDGNWSPWSKWDMCSVSCGTGFHYRFRTCSNPRPSLGGKLCVGVPEEVKTCNEGPKCPVDGNWAHWSAWKACDAKCGKGYQLRVRTCSDPPPLFGGKLCFGIAKEKRQCDSGIPCHIDGNWSPWSNWDICDAKCGYGYQRRVRTCTNPKPQFGGMDCLGIPQERRQCQNDVACPVDGNWGAWANWEACDADCGIGKRKRLRYCNSPAPQYGGMYCAGGEVETEECDTGRSCYQKGAWSLWGRWSGCSSSCGVGYQFRVRYCNNPPPQGPGMGCQGYNEERVQCNTNIVCPVNGGWTEWTLFGKCLADCSRGAAYAYGYKIRQRFCENPPPSNGGLPCRGDAVERVECFDFPPCFEPEWSMWTKWTKCSEECGPGQQERTRTCQENALGRPANNCKGQGKDVIVCKVLDCPTTPLNCSTECKWDNGIGYAMYPGDCTMFVQCDSIDGIPVVQDCAYGLLWSLNILQCVFPAQSECDVCEFDRGRYRPYHISCRAYWDCTLPSPVPKCCAKNERFNPFTHQCEIDHKGLCNEECPPVEVLPPEGNGTSNIPVCKFKPSIRGDGWYEEELFGVWQPRPCSGGTIFSEKECQCIYYTDGFMGPKKECVPELHLAFETLEQDLARNVGLHVENVTYLGDGTAYFDGNAAINDNIFSNIEWGQNVFVYIRFKPEGQGHNQGLVHNSGCGPSDIGPSVFIGIDRQPQLYGPDMINMKFAAVPKKKNLEYDFVNITTPADQMIDAWFKFGKGNFKAEVNGLTAMLDIPGASAIDRRHGSVNIGGNLCKIGNESFGGFVGTLDEVRIYKCKPPGIF
ncbi:SCO-spondin-like isoform X2 [Mercenaria mercenaria]|uniref:SCO-spondin-like isoform X2 n=1 Tax=Mercenaria mercenaria TaxID=6596 RepID=UPI00234F68D3|nr:SCO-spondin-like isoform X2 [Mercenaria mercenaria]